MAVRYKQQQSVIASEAWQSQTIQGGIASRGLPRYARNDGVSQPSLLLLAAGLIGQFPDAGNLESVVVFGKLK